MNRENETTPTIEEPKTTEITTADNRDNTPSIEELKAELFRRELPPEYDNIEGNFQTTLLFFSSFATEEIFSRFEPEIKRERKEFIEKKVLPFTAGADFYDLGCGNSPSEAISIAQKLRAGRYIGVDLRCQDRYYPRESQEYGMDAFTLSGDMVSVLGKIESGKHKVFFLSGLDIYPGKGTANYGSILEKEIHRLMQDGDILIVALTTTAGPSRSLIKIGSMSRDSNPYNPENPRDHAVSGAIGLLGDGCRQDSIDFFQKDIQFETYIKNLIQWRDRELEAGNSFQILSGHSVYNSETKTYYNIVQIGHGLGKKNCIPKYDQTFRREVLVPPETRSAYDFYIVANNAQGEVEILRHTAFGTKDANPSINHFEKHEATMGHIQVESFYHKDSESPYPSEYDIFTDSYEPKRNRKKLRIEDGTLKYPIFYFYRDENGKIEKIEEAEGEIELRKK